MENNKINSTIDKDEVAKFSSIADQWWDESGEFKPLHKFNPIRLNYLREEITKHYNLDQGQEKPLNNIKILDVGCGGGLLSEPLANLGADMVGIDAAQQNISVAKIHSQKSGVFVDYRHVDVEELADGDEKFDVVLAMEIIEHVADVDNFVTALSGCLKPNGLLFVATINRTAKSYLQAIIGAEYILRWLKIGTHSWKKFLKPSEIAAIAQRNQLHLMKNCGFNYNPIRDIWSLSNNLDVNYVMVLKKNND